MSSPNEFRPFRWIPLYLMLTSSALAETGDTFSLAIIADPHIRWSHYAQNTARLERCVDWINANVESRDIHFVFVLGDIGWESTGTRLNIEIAKEVLDGLDVPYVPIIGDDDILFGRGGYDFALTFEPVYQILAGLAADPTTGFYNWQRGPVTVESPYEPGVNWHFQNFAFEYRGVHFVCVDWCSRDGSKTLFGTRDDDSDLHDFPGGTWPWFTQCLAERFMGKEENIVIMSHTPMVTLRGGWFMRKMAEGLTFSQAEFAKLSGFLEDLRRNYGDHIHAVYSGHVHFRGYLPQDADPARVELPDWLLERMSERTAQTAFPPLPGYDLYTIQALHVPYPPFGPPTHPDNEVRLELVTVTEGQTRFSYVSQSILVP